jgi:alpha-amylase/alpha-mannosidase (GH57 family)
MSDTRLPVVLFWHMHQPPYRDALSGRYVLPWTWLHAIKDYTDMAAHLEQVEGARAVVNFTPVLVEQIEDLAAAVRANLDSGAPLPDPLLATLSYAPLPHDPAERQALLQACVRAQHEQVIRPREAFARLVDIAHQVNEPARAGYVTDQFLHDLAVWYHLAWMGESVRRSHPLVARLEAKAHGFDAADRHELLSLIGELLSGLLPRYRALADAGRCELATSPFAHPILPLLIDFGAAREGEPHAPRPQAGAYPGGAERAAWHLQRAMEVHQRVFGRRPRTCWPSEGALSEPAVAAIEAAGFDCLASSVSVLAPSLALSGQHIPGHQDEAERLLNRPWRLPESRVSCFFRHDGLSDLIGFTYNRWHGDDAAAHFVNELAGIEQRTAGEPDRIVLVALDGENAWEHYPHNGWYFLNALYRGLADHPRLKLTTLSQFVDEQRVAGITPRVLPRLRAGSWVYGTLSTWMGDPDKNRGWDLLVEAKHAYDEVVASGRLNREELARATLQLAACESSDWYWWFGDYNPAEAVRDFDQLFRHQLTSLYQSLGLAPPAHLDKVISVGHGNPEAGGVMRRS